MKTIVAILLLGMTGPALAEPGKPAEQPITVYKGGKPYIYDRNSTPYRAGAPYIDDPLIMRLHAPAGFRKRGKADKNIAAPVRKPRVAGDER